MTEKVVECAATSSPTLVLHQFPRSAVAPSLSPFALKLETYLRMSKTAYQNDFSKPTSSKGKCPWITYNNNQDVADSSMCVDFLKNVTNVDLNAHLSASEKAIARAFQKMVEEELVWVFSLWRWTYDKDETIVKEMGAGKIKSYLMLKMFRSRVKGYAHGHGIGRHSQAEVIKIGEDDVKALADFLGTKKYFMGELVSEVDCAIFGLLAQVLYTSPTCPLTTFIKDHHANLITYCDLLKAEVWPDWDEICHSVTVEKEKKKVCKTTSVASNAEAVEPVNAAAVTGNGIVNGENGHTESEVVVISETTTKSVIVENGQAGDTVKTVQMSNGDGVPKENGHHTEAAAPAV